jgi:hypothetical protein
MSLLHRYLRSAVKPLRFRFSIATFAVVVALVAIDIVWIRTVFIRHRSVFGFMREGYDIGLFLMAHVLPFGLYPMIHRRGPGKRFLIGFETGGLAAALGYAGFAWFAPEKLLAAASVPMDPIWNLCFGWLSNGTLEYVITLVVFLALGLGFPQLLIALACGILVRRGFAGYYPVATSGRPVGGTENSPRTPDERSARKGDVLCTSAGDADIGRSLRPAPRAARSPHDRSRRFAPPQPGS